MCFSAPASFAAAAVTGGIGIGCFARAQGRSELPLAAMPLWFSLQQFVEGLLWLTLPVAPQSPDATVLTIAFLLFAVVLWPVYVPLAALLVEPDGRRRALMWVLAGAGAVIAAYFAGALASEDHRASILGGHIFYEAPRPSPPWVAVTYMIATCVPLLASSRRALNVLGMIVSAGALLSYAFYWQVFTSVWCFFAAAASVVLYHHFAREARARALAGARMH